MTALVVTTAGGVFLAAVFAFGILNAGRVSDRWLERPRAAFFTLGPPSFNPWSPRVIHRSPLQYLSFALALPVLRLFAAANNTLIYNGNVGPIGFAVRWVGDITTPAAGLVLVVGGLYYLLAVLMVPLAGSLIRAHR